MSYFNEWKNYFLYGYNLLSLSYYIYKYNIVFYVVYLLIQRNYIEAFFIIYNLIK